MEKEELTDQRKVEYFTFHTAQILSGLIFLSVAIMSFLFYDYGLLTFLFAMPQFILTGLIPFFIAVLILLRGFYEAENISIEEKGDKMRIEVIRKIQKLNFKFEPIELQKNAIQYSALKYRETRAKRWIIILILVLFTIEVHYQNAVDLNNFARIAPWLAIWTVILFCGIILFTFSPRRWLEIADDKETLFIPFKQLSNKNYETFLKVFNIDQEVLKRESFMEIILANIKAHSISFILGLYLIFLGIFLMITPTLYLGSFTRVIAIVYGMKLILRVLNGDPYFNKSTQNENLYLGNSPKLTFIKFRACEKKQIISLSPMRYHLFEILCIAYLIFQAIHYAFRFIWWPYEGFNIIYFTLGMLLIGLLFLRWFNPILVDNLNLRDISITIRIQEELRIGQQLRKVIDVLKEIKSDRNVQFLVIFFIIIILFAFLYSLFGGNFLLI
ncbi:MAG: hypothetical protein ACTSR8_09720 [Promethearchaeota archaeon]